MAWTEHWLGALLFGGFGVAFALFARHELRTGTAMGAYSQPERTKQPVQFWLSVGINIIAGLLCIWGALGQVAEAL